MADTIDRRTAIRALEKMKDVSAKGDLGGFYNTIVNNAIDKLKNLPSAQPEQKWIPCKERLPEMDEEVLVTTDWDTVTIGERWYNDKWFIDAGNQNAVDEDIIAWMPLPEPYQGSEQDEKVHY